MRTRKMRTRRITASFKLFGKTSVAPDKLARQVDIIRRAINNPSARERMRLMEMYGYYEVRPTGEDHENPPAFRTISVKVDDDGTVTHVQELFGTETGDEVSNMQRSGVGGWSWAYTDGLGRPDFRVFSGFDYKRYPNINDRFGKTSALFEGAPEDDQRLSMIKTGTGASVSTQWQIRDLSDLVMSNQPDGRINPDFPAELQPRDRTRLKSQLQVLDIARTMDFDRLSRSEWGGAGAPIIGPDNVVESGNGRTMGIARAYGSQQADQYRQSLIAALGDFGLSKADLDGISEPVLVRQRLDDVDRVQFAQDCNVQPTGQPEETRAMLEAARKPKIDEPTPPPSFRMCSSVKDVIGLIRVAQGKLTMQDRPLTVMKFVADQLMALKNRQLTRTEYIRLTRPLLGKPTDAYMFQPDSMMDTLRQVLPNCPPAALPIDSEAFEFVVYEGKGFDVPAMVRRWVQAGNGSNEASTDQRRAAAQDILKASEDAMTLSYANGLPVVKSYNGRVWAWLGWICEGQLPDINALRRASYQLAKYDMPLPAQAKKQYDEAVGFGQSWLESTEAPRKATLRAMREDISEGNLADYLTRLRAKHPGLAKYASRLTAMIHSGQFIQSDDGAMDGISVVLANLDYYTEPSWGHSSATVQLRGLMQPYMDAIKNEVQQFIATSKVKQADADQWIGTIDIEAKLLRAHEKRWGKGVLLSWIKECYQLGGGKFKTLRYFILDRRKKPRACAHEKGYIVMNGDTTKETVWHEMGHHFEFSNQDSLVEVMAYLKARQEQSGNTDLVRLKEFIHSGFDADEIGIKDQLSQPYVGKVYGDLSYLRASEVISTGFGNLACTNAIATGMAGLNNDNCTELVLGILAKYVRRGS